MSVKHVNTDQGLVLIRRKQPEPDGRGGLERIHNKNINLWGPREEAILENRDFSLEKMGKLKNISLIMLMCVYRIEKHIYASK